MAKGLEKELEDLEKDYETDLEKDWGKDLVKDLGKGLVIDLENVEMTLKKTWKKRLGNSWLICRKSG